MKWYPWLNTPYKEIITLYKKKQGHHALLLHSHHGTGSNSLIYAITRWLMCKKTNDIKSCGNCHGCHLMLANTHPDCHIIFSEKNKHSIGIESIRNLIQNLYNHAQQNGVKVVWFPCVEILTQTASNALLKTLEEPEDNTYFLLECHNLFDVLPTLRSRCFYYYLAVPDHAIVFSWLRKQKISSTTNDINTAIKLTAGAPISAFMLLQPNVWIKRKDFFKLLKKNLSSNTLLNWLPELNQSNAIERIFWLITILLDAIKYQQKLSDYCINQDQLLLISELAKMTSSRILLKSAYEWQNCRYQLISIMGLNQELLLTSQLINWQNSLIKIST
ncbi:DNA polymerase III subunit delta' [Arsenophonus symbiont of Ornithomya chloropus]|uniref:DNA polymerase III subunit delta' n=1 Tax=Arsenophonus symbiont of Ornithomya chloropus TaxID=634121 RepID=UPI0032B16B90